MKTNSTSKTRFIALLLAIVMVLGLAACGADTSNTVMDGNGGSTIEDTGVLPDANGSGLPRGNGGTTTSGLPRGGTTKTDPEKELKRYGDIETLTKSVKTPSKPDTKNTKMDNSYGTVDWSTAANGYITFTAKGQTRVFLLQGPNDAQGLFEVAKGDSIKVALTGGAGKYQYAIANNTNNGKSYSVQYKNSFQVKSIDADLVPYLVSTAWGDYENAPNAVAKAKELWDSKKTQLENIETIAKYVRSLKYDKKLKLGTIDKYVNPDVVIENGGGVCNEMSKLLVAMLRSQGVPAYYQGGTKQGEGHSWVRAWVELSSSTKNGVTSSKGAWINIEATSASLLRLDWYNKAYDTTDPAHNYAN